MLDVHPPHHPTHTWKDFFIHIATISVGLLIAVGLEQTVEYVHHAHQRSELLEDLQREADYNKATCEGNIPYFDQHLGWLLEVKAVVDQYRVDRTRPSALPAEPALAHGAFKDRAYQSATWTSANTAGLLGLLSREQAAPYSLAYELKEQAETQDVVNFRAETAFKNFLVGTPQAPFRRDLSQLSSSQLEQLSMAVAETFTTTHQERDFILIYYATLLRSRKGEHGYPSREDAAKEAARKFPDPYTDFGTYVETEQPQ
jgi:hypothetical protein